MGFKMIQKFIWYFSLIGRNNTKKFRKIVVITRDKRAAVKPFIQTSSATSETKTFNWPEISIKEL